MRETSVTSIRDYSYKGGGHVQAMPESTPTLCCAVNALNIIGTWLIRKSLLEAINQVCPLVNLNAISFRLLYFAPEACSNLDYHMLPVPYNHACTKL